jgi:hypothetical protein
MTVATLEKGRVQRETVPSRVLLGCDGSGSWTLSGLDIPARRFSDFEAAFDSARHVPGGETAIIEVWQSGEYICCLPPQEWPHGVASTQIATSVPKGHALATAERWANRAAQVLMPVDGMFFWFALMAVALGVSLGWRLFFF